MNTTLSTKFTALVLALAINTFILGGVALMFDTHVNGLTAAAVAAKSVAVISLIS